MVLRSFWLAWAGLGALLGIAAVFYSTQQHIPLAQLTRVLPAFTLEGGCYLLLASESWRNVLLLLPRPLLLWSLWASAVVPYVVYAGLTGTFSLAGFGMVAALFGLVCCWFAETRLSPLTDLLFLALVLVVLLTPLLPTWYVRLWPKLPTEILGKLTFVRLSILCVLLLRGLEHVRLGFAPTRREWRIGVAHYLLFLPVGGALMSWLSFGRFHPASPSWGRNAGLALLYFCAIFAFVAPHEEFFCRGYLQQLLGRWLRLPWLGLLLASLLFGLLHLPYGKFPNWNMVALATVAGLFYGSAYARAGGVRASMVTHAMVVATWRVFFS